VLYYLTYAFLHKDKIGLALVDFCFPFSFAFLERIGGKGLCFIESPVGLYAKN